MPDENEDTTQPENTGEVPTSKDTPAYGMPTTPPYGAPGYWTQVEGSQAEGSEVEGSQAAGSEVEGARAAASRPEPPPWSQPGSFSAGSGGDEAPGPWGPSPGSGGAGYGAAPGYGGSGNPPDVGAYPPGSGSTPPGSGSTPPGYGSMPPGYGPPPGYGSTPPGYGPPPGFGYGGSGYPYDYSSSPQPDQPTRRRWPYGVIGAIAAAVLLAGAAGGLVGHELDGSRAANPASSSNNPGSRFSPGGRTGNSNDLPNFGQGSGSSNGSGPSDASAIASRVDPGLVDVNTTIDYGTAEGAGTGMVLTPNGEVLTNNHVVEGATSISVTDVGNGRTYSATVVGYDESQDVAVLQLSGASGLQTVHLGDSSKVSTGEQVVGIGNAGGSGGTPSYAGGTVTAVGRSITANDELTGTSEHLTNMIETNADIISGDSGGALVNSSGEVIGMDTAGSGTFQMTSSSSVGFAIPINEALRIAHQIESHQPSSTVHVGPTAFLGVQISMSSSGNNGFGGFGGGGSGSGSSVSGAAISGVVSGSPASGAGLGAGDVVTSLGGHGVTSATSLQKVLVEDEKPGATVSVTYTDSSGQQHTVQLILASGPPA